MEDERLARHIVEEDADGVTAGQLPGLRGDDVEQALAIEAGGQLTRHRVEPRRFLLAGARRGIESALFERHREVLAERAERLDAQSADRAPARLGVGADRADAPPARAPPRRD